MLRDGFPQLREAMREQIRELQKPGEPELGPYAFDTEVLRRTASIFTRTWLEDILQAELDPVAPGLVNSDGDMIEFMTVRYPLGPDADRKALAAGIAAIPGFRAVDDSHWNWSEAPRTSAPADTSEGVKRFATFLPDGSVSLGDVELDGDSLKLTTNSPQRAGRARALLDPVIGPFVGEPIVESRTIEEMADSQPAERESPPPSGLSPEEEREFVHQTLDRHYRAVLDQPVPMLGDVSPREAARTTGSQEKLVNWLKVLENSNAQLGRASAIATYDVRWIWEELGVSNLRR
jgi:hypothetical protein